MIMFVGEQSIMATVLRFELARLNKKMDEGRLKVQQAMANGEEAPK
jgi:hypothetical protein